MAATRIIPWMESLFPHTVRKLSMVSPEFQDVTIEGHCAGKMVNFNLAP
jgi:hypothetical protein